MPEHHVIDYDAFLLRLVTSLRKAWEEVRRQRPDETFYMFGVATDSDVVVLTPFWNTEEQYAKEGNPEFPIDKWVVPQHGYDYCEHTDSLQDEVNRYIFEDHADEPEQVFEARKATLLEIFEKAMVQLDREGFFGVGSDRRRVLLKVDRGDCSDDEEQYMLDAICRLNPPEAAAPFFAALRQEKDRQRAKEREKDLIKAMAIEHLRRQGLLFDRCSNAVPVRTPGVAKLLRESGTTDGLWEVWFDAPSEPKHQMHRAGLIIVVVNPETGDCTIEP